MQLRACGDRDTDIHSDAHCHPAAYRNFDGQPERDVFPHEVGLGDADSHPTPAITLSAPGDPGDGMSIFPAKVSFIR
jgi:hypothetical protein